MPNTEIFVTCSIQRTDYCMQYGCDCKKCPVGQYHNTELLKENAIESDIVVKMRVIEAIECLWKHNHLPEMEGRNEPIHETAH